MASLHLQQNWQHYAGESERVVVAIDLEDASVDLSSAISRLSINVSPQQSSPQISVEGTVVNSAKGWRAIVPIPKGTTMDLPAGDYLYQVEIETDDELRVICAGAMQIDARLGSSD